eukprot:539721-Pelagomonas_calceolata.AAC.1
MYCLYDEHTQHHLQQGRSGLNNKGAIEVSLTPPSLVMLLLSHPWYLCWVSKYGQAHLELLACNMDQALNLHDFSCGPSPHALREHFLDGKYQIRSIRL